MVKHMQAIKSTKSYRDKILFEQLIASFSQNACNIWFQQLFDVLQSYFDKHMYFTGFSTHRFFQIFLTVSSLIIFATILSIMKLSTKKIGP